MVLWMLWRRGLLEDFSDLTAASLESFPAPLDVPGFSPLRVLDAAAPSTDDGPGPAATESPCPTALMALILSLGRVLVEPME